MTQTGLVLILLSLISLAFLIYTLINRETLGITITHPRVIVELSIFLILLSLGFLL